MNAAHAIASLFIPGLGQALSGRRLLAAVWAMLAALAYLPIVFGVWLLVLVLVVRVACAVHAFRTTRAVRLESAETILAVLATVGVALATPFALRAYAVEAFKIPSSSMYPTLHIGDHLFIDKRAYSPRHGDVIVFRLPCETERDYDKRVAAVAGDAIEIRCDVVFVNGQALSHALVDGNATYEDYDEYSGQTFVKEVARYSETNDGASYEVFHQRDRDGESKDFPRERAPSCSDAQTLDAHPAANQQPGEVRAWSRRAASGPCDRQREYVVPPGHVFVLGDNRGNANDSRFWGSVPVENIKGRAIGIWWARDLSRLGSLR